MAKGPGTAETVTAAPAPPARHGSSSKAPPKAAPVRPPSRQPAASTISFTDDDELILELTTPRHELSDTIIAYNRRGVPYLPLGEIARILDLAVTVSDEGRYASGWVLEPGHTVALNLREGTLTVDGQVRPLSADDAVAFDGELYLRADRFGDIFPLTLNTNLRAQTVTVQTRARFPFELRQAREDARERLKSRQGAAGQRAFPRDATPWRALDFPLLDAELRAASDTIRGPRAEADFRIAGDLVWLTARSFLSMDSLNGLTTARLEMGRRDPDGNLLGPFHATGFGMGDVTSTPLPMGLAGVSGRGAWLGNAPLERASVFDRIELRGDMPDGYEAELYRNNILIDTAATAQDGQYRFLNIPVEFGLNVFRIVLYGPQGQRREVVRQISVGDGRLGKGEFIYSLGVVQKNQPLFALHGRDYVPGVDDGALRTTAQVQYGISGGLTAMLGGAWFDRLGTRRWLGTAGLRTGLAGFAFKLDLGQQSAAPGMAAGRAVSVGLARRIGGFSITINHAEYSGSFADEVRSFSDQDLRRASEVTINGVIRIGKTDTGLRIPVNGLLRDLTFADGRRVQTASMGQALPLSRALQLSHLVEFNRTRSSLFGGSQQLRGSFDLTTLSRSSTQFRASLGYALAPHTELTSVAVQVDRRIGPKASVSASAGRNFAAGQNRFGLSAQRRFDRFALSLDGSYATNPGQYSAMLRLSFSLGRNPLDGRLFMAQSGMATGGAVALRAFRDLDGDGRYEPGEPAVADTRFFTGSEQAQTDQNGFALLGKLGDGPRTSVRVDADSLPDVALAPVVEGIELAPRAGRIHLRDFAIRALGELDGTALFQTASGNKPVSGLVVVLVDAQGKLAGRTRTASDGTFWFEKLAAGDYRLMLDDGQANRLKIRLAEPVPLLVDASGPHLRRELHVLSTTEGIIQP